MYTRCLLEGHGKCTETLREHLAKTAQKYHSVKISADSTLQFKICTSIIIVGRPRDRFPVVSLGIFFPVVPPTEPCALRSTQPLNVSTRDFSWGKGGRYVWLTNYHPGSAETSRKSGALIYPEPLGPPRPVAGDLYLLLSLCMFGIYFNSYEQDGKMAANNYCSLIQR